MTRSNAPNATAPGGINIKSLLLSLLINVAIPLLIFEYLTRYQHAGELFALSIAAVVPLLSSLIELLRNHRLDLVAIFYLLGTLTSIIAIFLGGDARLLIIRESLFTGALGLACFVSLLALPRPLMFYVGRQMTAGRDKDKIVRYNAGWQNPHIRATHRLITTIWGCALCGEFLLRTLIAFTLPVAVALTLGSTLFILVLAGTFAWTFAYARRVTQHQHPGAPDLEK